MSVEENHALIKGTIHDVCNRLNQLKVDYYLVGALSTFIGTNTPLFRYHGDIDFMIEERDIEKVKQALQGTKYEFSDNRLNNKRTLKSDKSHPQGEHEVIANHKDNEFHLGFLLFRREKNNSITVREYFMQENENGERVPMVLERYYLKELVDLEYTQEKTEYAGTTFRTSTPESVYAKKLSTRHPKDILDLEKLKDKIDYNKLKEMNKYPTTQKIVNPGEIKQDEHLLVDSAIAVTEEVTRTGMINEQLQSIKNIVKELKKEQHKDSAEK